MTQYQNNPFAGMTSGDQSIGVRLPYLEDGDYKLKIGKVNVITRRKDKKPFYLIETEVVESNVPARPTGMRCTSMIDLSNADMRGKNITGFLCAVFGYDPTVLPKDSLMAPWVDPNARRNVEWAEYANWSVQENNPLAGAMVGCRVTTIQTVGTGDDFSVHQWIPMALMIIGPMQVARPSSSALPQGPAPAGAQNWGPPAGPGGTVQAPAPAAAWGPPPAQGGAPAAPGNGGWGPPAAPVGQPAPQGGQPGFGPPGPPAGPQPGFGPPAGAPAGMPAGAPASGPGFGPPAQGGVAPGQPSFGPWGQNQPR